MYNERYGIVNGVVEAENSVKDSEVVNQEVDAAEKGVPNFWLHALANHELLDAEISVPDGEALKYLTDIKWLRKDDFKGFILPFFQNPFLTKTYEFLDQYETILQKASGIEIEWYPGNCLTREYDSFFNFFNPIPIDENTYRLIEEMKRDYYIGSFVMRLSLVLFYGI
uniref:nucleosome assembly protein 1;2-like isoform X2 n=1 Tax=Fragaria vesca subsp. vesca TaxID=101020 RepID=UPI0005CA7245|nr:PREDICTED: nucleosome assembly protein 1;2-like isoform X2 [Fragaria vesca subsp. vesca]